jgi:hypothetical protein
MQPGIACLSTKALLQGVHVAHAVNLADRKLL